MRVFNKIINNYSVKTKIPFPIFDIYHFKWNPFCRTPIHDHAKNGCITILIRGKLNERIYDKELNFIEENNHKAPNISFINDKKGYHSVKSDGWSSSIHIYYPKDHHTKKYVKK